MGVMVETPTPCDEPAGVTRGRRRSFHRFRDRYERRRLERKANPPRFYVRPLRVVTGFLLILLASVIGPIVPGPGFIILAPPGAFLLASELRWVAEMLDRGEATALPRLQRWWSRLHHRRLARRNSLQTEGASPSAVDGQLPREP